jgi:hypothetical protein
MVVVFTSLVTLTLPTVSQGQTPVQQARQIVQDGLNDIQDKLNNASLPFNLDIRRGLLLVRVTGTDGNDGPRFITLRQTTGGDFIVRGANRRAHFCNPFDPNDLPCYGEMDENAGRFIPSLEALEVEELREDAPVSAQGWGTPSPCDQVAIANMGPFHVQQCGADSSVRPGYYYFTNATNQMFLFVPQ